MRLGAFLPPEEDPATGYQPAPTPILTTAPKVNGTTGTNGPTLAPDGNGDIAPALIPYPFEPSVICAPGWTGPDCKTRISDRPALIPYPFEPSVICAPGWTGPDCKTRISDLQPAGLPTGVEPAPPGTIVPSEVTRAPNGARPDYKMRNGVAVRVLEKEGVEKGFLIGPIAIAAAVTVGLIVLLRDRR